MVWEEDAGDTLILILHPYNCIPGHIGLSSQYVLWSLEFVIGILHGV